MNQRPVDIVYQSLKSRILDGTYSPSETLVELSLVDEYHVSHNTVKKALLMLLNDGLISMEANKSARVKAISVQELSDSMDLRAVLEHYMMLITVPVLTDETVLALDEAVHSLASAVDSHSFNDYITHYLSFQQVLLNACPNKVLTDTAISKSNSKLYKYLNRALILPGSANDLAEFLLKLIGLIRAKDAEGAAQAMKDHVNRVKDYMINNSAYIL